LEASTESKVFKRSTPGIALTSIEVTTLRKLRTRLLPFLLALYVIAFIDRTNLGFAALTMNPELAITSEQFGLAAGIFFLGYFLLEIPSNLILHRIGAQVWIPRILITWGAVATLTGFVHLPISSISRVLLLGSQKQDTFPVLLCIWAIGFRRGQKHRRWR
jgi:MFS transporter, ACS family, tartrate transporter